MGREHPMLAARAVTVVRGGVAVVKDLTIDVGPGEVVVLLGPSGAGKSSLLLAIAGLVDVAAGDVWAGRLNVTAAPAHRRRVGMMFQEFALFPHFDVRSNVRYGLAGRGTSVRDREEVASRWLDRVGLPPAKYGERDVATLSGGQRQRVALARALAPQPQVLLLDEPFGALDRQLREDLVAEFVPLFRQPDGPAVLAVTHDRDEAFTMGDRVGVMRDGVLVAHGPPDELWRRPGDLWTARFLGHPNVLEPAEAAALGLHVPEPVIVPPEAVAVSPDDGTVHGVVATVRWQSGRRIADVVIDGGPTLQADVTGGAPVQPAARVMVRVSAGAVRPVA